MLWLELRANREHLGRLEIQRREHLDLTDQPGIQDAVCTYEVRRDGQPLGTVRHRYGDGRWKLLALAAELIVEHDAETQAPPGRCHPHSATMSGADLIAQRAVRLIAAAGLAEAP